MGLAAEPQDSQAPQITMLKKKGKRVIENADEIMDHLQRVFPWAKYNSLDGEAVASMSIREQVCLPQHQEETIITELPRGRMFWG